MSWSPFFEEETTATGLSYGSRGDATFVRGALAMDFPEAHGLEAISLLLFLAVAYGLWWAVLPIVLLPGLIMSVVCRNHRVLLWTSAALLVLPSLELWRESSFDCDFLPQLLLANPFLASGVIIGIAGLVRWRRRRGMTGPSDKAPSATGLE